METDESTAPQIDTSKVSEIYAEPPPDLYEDPPEAPQPDPSDFEDIEDTDIEDDNKGPDPDPDPDPHPQDPPEPGKKSKAEIKQRTAEVKKEIVRMITPERCVKFADMFLSRAGSFAMARSDRKDWQLDEEEIELLADILDAMMEEEGIEFWPAKVWLIIALVFIYAMKTVDVYDMHYSKAARLQKQPQLMLEEREKEHEAHTKRMEAMEMEIAEMEREAELLARKKEVDKKIKNIKEPRSLRREKKPDIPLAEDHPFTKENYPPHIYHWKNGKLQFTKDNQPAKRPGRKGGRKLYHHPVTGDFVNKETYDQLMAEMADKNGHDRGKQKNDESDVISVEAEELPN